MWLNGLVHWWITHMTCLMVCVRVTCYVIFDDERKIRVLLIIWSEWNNGSGVRCLGFSHRVCAWLHGNMKKLLILRSILLELKLETIMQALFSDKEVTGMDICLIGRTGEQASWFGILYLRVLRPIFQYIFMEQFFHSWRAIYVDYHSNENTQDTIIYCCRTSIVWCVSSLSVYTSCKEKLLQITRPWKFTMPILF